MTEITCTIHPADEDGNSTVEIHDPINGDGSPEYFVVRCDMVQQWAAQEIECRQPRSNSRDDDLASQWANDLTDRYESSYGMGF